MLHEPQIKTPWINVETRDLPSFSEQDWQVLHQEALDALDYVEEKLLLLENKPQEAELLRPVFNTFIRIHELARSLRLRPGLELVKNTKAFLEYTCKECRSLQPEDIVQLFDVVDVLQSVFRFKQELTNRDSTVAFTRKLKKNYQKSQQWFQQQLKELENHQRSRLEGKSPDLKDLLIAQNLVPLNVLDQVIDQKKPEQPLGELLVKEGCLSQEKLHKTIQLQQSLQEKPIHQEKQQSKGLRKLKSLSGDLGATLHYLQKWLGKNVKNPPYVAQLMNHLHSIQSAIGKQVQSLAMYPTQQLAVTLEQKLESYCQEHDKNVQLSFRTEPSSIEHSQVKLVEGLLERLMHHSIEHGMESSEERVALGKSSEGSLQINAFYEENFLVFSLEHDGRSLEVQRLQEDGVKLGLCTPNEEMTDERLSQLLFCDGLVLKSHCMQDENALKPIMDDLKAHNGKLSFQHRKGGGSVFRLAVPLPPSYIHGIIVQYQKENYLIPTSMVKDMVPMSELQQNSLAASSSPYQWEPTQSGNIPAICSSSSEAKALPSLSPSKQSSSSPPHNEEIAVFIETPEGSCLLKVEKVKEEQMIELRFVGSSFIQNPLIGGGGVLANGQYVWLLNTTELSPQKADA